MDLTHMDSYIQFYGYNLTLANNENGTVIEGVTINKCGGSKLKSFIIEMPSEFCNLKAIRLFNVPIIKLMVEDLMDFPKLQTLFLRHIPISFMENGLLCHNLNITILQYTNSFGYLTAFPSQIFNCTIPLNLKFLAFVNHIIASLPAFAFGSAAEQLRVLQLWNIGLEVIHRDAFTGLINLQVARIDDNKLLEVSSVMIPPSAHLHILEYKDDRLKGTLNLTTMHVRVHCCKKSAPFD